MQLLEGFKCILELQNQKLINCTCYDLVICSVMTFAALHTSGLWWLRISWHTSLNILQGNVATYLTSGGIFNDRCVANFLENVKIRYFENRSVFG